MQQVVILAGLPQSMRRTVGETPASVIPKGATVDSRMPRGYRFGGPAVPASQIYLTEIQEVSGGKAELGYAIIKRTFFKLDGPMTAADKTALNVAVTGREPPGLATWLALPVMPAHAIQQLAAYALNTRSPWVPVFEVASADGRYYGQYVVPRAAADKVSAANSFVAEARRAGEHVVTETRHAVEAGQAAAKEIARQGRMALESAGTWGKWIAIGAIVIGAGLMAAPILGPMVMGFIAKRGK